MAKKSFQISIAEPCSENWEQMAPNQQGRFCEACKKAVIDLTTLTDKEIVHLVKKSKGELCGRITTLQQEKVYNFHEETIFGYLFSNAVFRNIAMLSGLALLGSKEAFAQNSIKKIKGVGTYWTEKQFEIEGSNFEKGTNSNKLYFLGRLVHKSDGSKIFANGKIIFENTKSDLIVDKNGRFSFEIPDEYINCEFLNFEIDVFGYNKIKFNLSSSQFNTEENVPLEISCNVVGYKTKHKSNKTGGISIRYESFIGPPEYNK